MFPWGKYWIIIVDYKLDQNNTCNQLVSYCFPAKTLTEDRHKATNEENNWIRRLFLSLPSADILRIPLFSCSLPSLPSLPQWLSTVTAKAGRWNITYLSQRNPGIWPPESHCTTWKSVHGLWRMEAELSSFRPFWSPLSKSFHPRGKSLFHLMRKIKELWLRLINNVAFNSNSNPETSLAKRQSPGLVNFVTALAYPFCLPLLAAFTQPGDHLLAEPCILW